MSGFSLSGFDGRGAELNNHDSTLLTPPSVVVSSSAFDDNTSNGLWVSTRGAISLTSVSANWNLDTGMYLRNQDGTANLTIQGTSKASLNNSYGVDLLSSGAVLISGLTAESNTKGLYIEDHSNALTINGSYFINNSSNGADIHMSGEGKPLTITRSHFYQNGNTGLFADTRGPIILNTVSANYNPSHGMQITNTNAAGNYPVTILQSYGLNHWDDNGGRGLFVTTRGNFSLTGFTASRNALAGIYFNGCVSEGSGCTGGGTVTINNGTTNENWDDGIFLFSNGPVTVKGITAFYNGYNDSGTRTPYEGNGITVHSHTFPVLISNSNINANYLHGIHAYLWGTGILTLSNVNYFGNNTSGASGVFDLKIE